MRPLQPGIPDVEVAVNPLSQPPDAWRPGNEGPVGRLPKQGGVIDIVAKPGQLQFCLDRKTGLLGFEQFPPNPTNQSLAFSLVGLVGLGRRHVQEVDPLQDDAPLFKIRTTGDLGVDIFQGESAFGGLFVVAIQAIGVEEGKDLFFKQRVFRRAQRQGACTQKNRQRPRPARAEQGDKAGEGVHDLRSFCHGISSDPQD